MISTYCFGEPLGFLEQVSIHNLTLIRTLLFNPLTIGNL
jgi:hypothetical protein